MTDGIRLLAQNDRGQTVDVTDSYEPADDGFTGETMNEEMASALAVAVFNLCKPGGQTPAAMDAVVRAVAKPCDCENCEMDERERKHRTEMEREQAIRLAKEARDLAGLEMTIASRRYDEADLAVLELTGDSPYYAALIRARLSGDREATRLATVEFYADLFLATGKAPPIEIADAVTERVAALRIERERH